MFFKSMIEQYFPIYEYDGQSNKEVNIYKFLTVSFNILSYLARYLYGILIYLLTVYLWFIIY